MSNAAKWGGLGPPILMKEAEEGVACLTDGDKRGGAEGEAEGEVFLVLLGLLEVDDEYLGEGLVLYLGEAFADFDLASEEVDPDSGFALLGI